jgi:hypothetical protein
LGLTNRWAERADLPIIRIFTRASDKILGSKITISEGGNPD